MGRSRVTSLDTRKGELARRLSYLLIKCLFVAICRKIFKLWFLRYKRKVIHRHLCRALAKKVRSLFRIVGYIYSSLSLKPTPLDAALSICLRDVSACCLRSWRDFTHATFLALAETRGIFAISDEAARELAPNRLVAPPPQKQQLSSANPGLVRLNFWNLWSHGI